MIGGITKGSCFSGCVEYVLALKEENKEARLLYSEGLLTDSPKDIVDGFECQRHLNSRVQHWCGHISLSYSPEDSARLSDEVMVKLALEYMEKMGIKNTQFIIARHLDKEHPHCHIVYNRVDNNGRCVSNSYEYYRSNAICKELKKKYGLTFGENKDKVKVDRLKGCSKTRQEIYLAVQAAKRTAKDWTSFQRELAQNGISVRKKFRRGTTDVEGLSYIKDGQKFKASQIDRDGRCSYKTICNSLDRNKNRQAQPTASAPRPMQQQPKQAPSATTKIIETGADMVEGLGNALDSIFQVGPAYDQDEEAFIREMNRRKKRKEAEFCNAQQRNMKQNFDNSPENFLQNIADDLSTISGTCAEIKESQLNCATTDDLDNMGTSITSAVIEKVDTMQSSIVTQTTTVKEIGDNLTTSVNNLKTEIAEKIDNFTANPPVRKIEKTIRIAKESWQVYLAMFVSVLTLMFFCATFI